MATPSLSKHTLPGALGEIVIDVRAGGRGSPRPAVILMHGYKGFKDWGMFPVFADRLARAGFSAVSFNVSGSGADDAGNFVYPERFGHNTFTAELADLTAVVGALSTGMLGVAPPSSIGLVGHSRGGGVAVLEAAGDARIRALVTWAAIASIHRWSDEERRTWRADGKLDVVNSRTKQVLPLYLDALDEADRNPPALDIEAAAAGIDVPWLIVHGTKDEAVDLADAQALFTANGRLSTRLLVIDGAGHTFGAKHPFDHAERQIDSVFEATLTWLATSLG